MVLVVEALGEVEEPRVVECGSLGHRHAHVEVLARVAHLREQPDVDVGLRESGRLELLADLVEQLAHDVANAPDVDL